ncbi:unnamed protein product [Allacma fusca]|uniref:Uncharacterized protein n=1 Tax=Allacma fusca TaxID=39272 RepID=A0A8J2P6V2_9HEXA|nr:unnamed protein product [Allacma fusca]
MSIAIVLRFWNPKITKAIENVGVYLAWVLSPALIEQRVSSQATEPADVCASVALILHYLHLVIGCWLFAHTLQTYRALCRHVAAPNLLSPDSEQDSTVESFRMVKPSTIRYSIAAWTAPVPFLISGAEVVGKALHNSSTFSKLI